VATFERHLDEALRQARQALVLTHHPPFYELTFPGEPSTDLDDLLWDAMVGNRGMEEVLQRNAGRVPLAFCGHTHRARESALGEIRGHNVGGDYHFKRLLIVHWPERRVEAHVFGNPERPPTH